MGQGGAEVHVGEVHVEAGVEDTLRDEERGGKSVKLAFFNSGAATSTKV